MRHVVTTGRSRRTHWNTRLLLSCAAAWLALGAGRASAEELGSRQNLVFSAERLFGFYLDNQTVDAGATDLKSDRTVIGLGWSNPTSSLSVPRLGVDYFISSAFTLGGNIGFFSSTVDSATTTGFLLGLRAGYAVRLGHAVSLWPRGGFTYTSTSLESSSSDTYTFALTFDIPFSFALTEGFAFLIGPSLDIGFLAERRDQDASEFIFGLMFGLAGWTNL